MLSLNRGVVATNKNIIEFPSMKRTTTSDLAGFLIMKNEIWSDIVDYEGSYQISSFGRIKSLDRIVKHPNGKSDFPIKGKLLKPSKSPNGYMRYAVSKNHVRTYNSIHRTVAVAFIPNPENKPWVNHINGIKTDNRVENLEWSTIKENVQHAIRTGLIVSRKGENCKNSKLTEKDVIDIRTNYSDKKLNYVKIGKIFSVSGATIGEILRGEKWKHLLPKTNEDENIQ